MMRNISLLMVILLSACNPNKELENFVTSPSGDRQFNYEVFFPDGVGKRPLILFSHGSGGDFSNYSWIIEELVGAGYAVATLNHPSNNARDNTNEGVIRVWDRPKDMSLLLDALLADPNRSERIDLNRIGAAGHSSGGYTAIALAGAVFDPGAMAAYCSSSERGPDCDLASENAVVDYSDASLSYRDARVKSVLAMAPAVGPGIDRSSLESIDVPVYIIATRDDELLGLNQHAAYYANHIPLSKLSLLQEGGHFIFIKCDIVTRVADWFIEELELCGRKSNVERAMLRRDVGSQVIEFFDGNIGQYPHNKSSKRDAVTGAPS